MQENNFLPPRNRRLSDVFTNYTRGKELSVVIYFVRRHMPNLRQSWTRREFMLSHKTKSSE